jgi:hypothetical protein
MCQAISGRDTAPPADTTVQFYLATTPGGTDSVAVHIEANAVPRLITAAEFGISDYATHRHITAVNSTAFELHYVVEML